jgi:sulfite exporter TauE/SafE
MLLGILLQYCICRTEHQSQLSAAMSESVAEGAVVSVLFSVSLVLLLFQPGWLCNFPVFPLLFSVAL